MDDSAGTNRILERVPPTQITALMQANVLWENGISGTAFFFYFSSPPPPYHISNFIKCPLNSGVGIRVAIFDTGLNEGHPHFRNVIERTDWTDENTLRDSMDFYSSIYTMISKINCFHSV